MPASFIESPRIRSRYSPSPPPAISGTETYSSMFSSASIGCAGATEPSSGRPSARTIPRTLSTALPTARSSSSIARGLEGSRRSSPIFSRLARCACTVEEDARPDRFADVAHRRRIAVLGRVLADEVEDLLLALGQIHVRGSPFGWTGACERTCVRTVALARGRMQAPASDAPAASRAAGLYSPPLRSWRNW